MGFAEWSEQKHGKKTQEKKTFRDSVSGVTSEGKLPPTPVQRTPTPLFPDITNVQHSKQKRKNHLRSLNDAHNHIVSQRGALMRSVKNGQYKTMGEAERALGFGTLAELNKRVTDTKTAYDKAVSTPLDTAQFSQRVAYLIDPQRKLSAKEQEEARELAKAYDAELRKKFWQWERTPEDLEKMADKAALEAKFKGGTQFGLGLVSSLGGDRLNRSAEQAIQNNPTLRNALPNTQDSYASARTQNPIAYGTGVLGGEAVKYGASAGVLGAIPKFAKLAGSKKLLSRLAAGRAIDLPIDLINAAMDTDSPEAFARRLVKDQTLGLVLDGGLEAVAKVYRMAKGAKAAKAALPNEVPIAPKKPLVAPNGMVLAPPERDYAQQINSVMRGEADPYLPIVIGDTPEILLQHGAKPHQLVLNQSNIRKIAYPEKYMGGKHNLGFFALKNLPNQLENPVAILKSSTQPNSLVVFTEFLDNGGRPVMIPIHLDKNGRVGVSNEIASMYGRNNFDQFIANQRKIGNVVYEDKNRSLHTLPSSGLQLPGVVSDTDPIFNSTIPRVDDSVKNQSMQNGDGYAKQGTVGAAKTGFDPYSKMINEHGAIPPGESPARVYDVPRKNAEGQLISKAARTLAEAGVTTDDALVIFEKMIANGELIKETITNKEALKFAEETIREEGFDGAIAAWNTAMKKRNINKEDIALGQTIYNQAVQNGDARLVQKMIADLVLIASESGRNLQATRMLKKLTPDGKLYGLEQSVSRINKDLLERYKGKHNEIQIPEELARKLLKAEDGKEADKVVGEIQQYIADRIPATFADKWNAWRYLSMLGNPRTHIRNTVGNAAFFGAVKIKNLIAQGIESSVNLLASGLGKDGMERTKAFNFDKGIRDFAKKDFLEMEDVIRSGGKHNPSNAINDKRQIFNTKWLEKARKLNTSALEMEDVFFMRPHYRQSLASYMSANKLTPEFLQSGTKEAYEALGKARTYAILEAKKATFRDDSTFASFLTQITKKLSSGSLIGKAGGILLEGALPFKKTPINILKRGLEYSPAGLANGLKKAIFDVKSGKATAAEAIDSIASGLTGSGVLALGMWLHSKDLISTGKEGDEGDETLRRMGGGQKYSLNVGGKSYTIDWLAPMALPFFVGAEVDKMRQDDGEKSLSDYINALGNIAEPMTELSLLQSINRTIKAARYGENPGTDMIMELATSYFGQGVPTILGQTARTIDPTRRATFIHKNSQVPELFQRFGQKQMAKIPGVSMLLQPSVNQFGQAQKNSGGGVLGRAAQNFLSPGYDSEDSSGAVEEALQILYTRTGDKSIIPSFADKNFKVNGKTKHLSAKEYTKYAKERGQKSKEILDELISLPQYSKLSDAEKAEAIKDAYQYANSLAKSNVSDYKLDERMQNIFDAEKKGVSPAKYATAYIAQKDVQPDKDSNGETISGTGKANKRDAIDTASPGMSFEEREVLYQSMGAGLTEVEEKKWSNNNVRRAVGSKENYYKAQELISSIKADKDEYGNSISGTAKEKEISAIASTLNVSKEKASSIYTELVTFKHSIDELSSREQSDWKVFQQRNMRQSDYLNYTNSMRVVEGNKNKEGKTISGSLKSNRYNKLISLGMTPAQAKYFLSVRYQYKW